ncbi:MAG: signal peptidase I [Treponema sp.]|nr:signal peptidase I [Treponema sp.]
MKNNRFEVEYKAFLLIELVSSALFTVFSLYFHVDLALTAFPLAALFTGFFAYFAIVKVLKQKDERFAYHVLKFIQYGPTVLFLSFILRRAGDYGTSNVFDWITVLLWTLNFIFSCVFQVVFESKRMVRVENMWAVKAPVKEKRQGIRWVLFEIWDWIDNILQIIVIMLIIQMFTFQLYVIPSESMVPEFLIGDRVFVEKILNGPNFPLTDVGLPTITKYKRGDIVVLRNPHYSMDRKSEFRSTCKILASMFTFNLKNFNTDENGEMKADPLVKRIAGLSGEQIVMQDGVLYTRTAASDEFKPIDPAEDYAAWNLKSLGTSFLRNVEYIPLGESEYQKMVDFEEERRNYDLGVAEVRAKLLVEKFNRICPDGNGRFTEPSASIMDIFNVKADFVVNAPEQKGSKQWFEKFMTSWIPQRKAQRDYYSESNFRLNVMAKMAFGELVVRNMEMSLAGDYTISEYMLDPIISKYSEQCDMLYWYVQNLLDMRNMPVFPANKSDGTPQYIPENCYFMMGDNRFNSLDLRHSYETSLKKLTDQDPMSIEYYSFMEPQYLNKKYIVGKPKYRFWPVTRRGSLNTGRKKN